MKYPQAVPEVEKHSSSSVPRQAGWDKVKKAEDSTLPLDSRVQMVLTSPGSRLQ